MASCSFSDWAIGSTLRLCHTSFILRDRTWLIVSVLYWLIAFILRSATIGWMSPLAFLRWISFMVSGVLRLVSCQQELQREEMTVRRVRVGRFNKADDCRSVSKRLNSLTSLVLLHLVQTFCTIFCSLVMVFPQVVLVSVCVASKGVHFSTLLDTY